MIICFVGSGGKTTSMRQYALEFLRQGKTVALLTSTHMAIESYSVLTNDFCDIKKCVDLNHIVHAGVKVNDIKMTSVSKDVYDKICDYCDVVLIEADGSRRLPLKYPADYEPVIVDNVDEIVIVSGLWGIGHSAKEVCHRLHLVKEVLNIDDEAIISQANVNKLVQKGYIEPLMNRYPFAKITYYPRNISEQEYLQARKEIADKFKK